MDGSAAVRSTPPSGREVPPDAPGSGLPGGSPPELEAALDPERNDELKGDGTKEGDAEAARKEASALGFLLGPTAALLYRVDLKFDTPYGTKRLRFVLRQMDGKQIEAIDNEHRQQGSSNPMAPIDTVPRDAHRVAEATQEIVDLETDESVKPSDARFIGDMPGGPAVAMEKRFRFQPGLLAALSFQVERISGFAGDRIEAVEPVTRAVGNS